MSDTVASTSEPQSCNTHPFLVVLEVGTGHWIPLEAQLKGGRSTYHLLAPLVRSLKSLRDLQGATVCGSYEKRTTAHTKMVLASTGTDATRSWMEHDTQQGAAIISSAYGPRHDPFIADCVKFHSGLDLAANEGTPVLAAASGTVTFAGMRGALGNYVEVLHADGLVTKYGHNSALFTQSGKRVRKGTPIAAMGMSGRATGPHLHFEIRDRHGVSHDPLPTLEEVCVVHRGANDTVEGSNMRSAQRPLIFCTSQHLALAGTGLCCVLDALKLIRDVGAEHAAIAARRLSHTAKGQRAPSLEVGYVPSPTHRRSLSPRKKP